MNQASLERLRGPLYLVAAIFVLTPCVDIIANVAPLHFQVAAWRFGATGVASNYLISIVFGAALAMTVAITSGTRFTMRTLGVLGMLAAMALLLASVYLLLDMLQLRGQVPSESLDAFQTGGWKTFFKLVSTALALGTIALALFRAAAQARSAAAAAFLISEQKA
ncbi:MAG TPA: hypothetical protein VGQ73_00150 [Gemmatimonadales bacterium]|jgi:hypothetical protein|nr:hypothetical protein [Gemmatimonadales bacterium]